MQWLIFGAAVLLGLGCGRYCAHSTPLTGLDGGSVACVISTDCPRPSSVLVCGQQEDQLRNCVACEANACVRYDVGTCP